MNLMRLSAWLIPCVTAATALAQSAGTPTTPTAPASPTSPAGNQAQPAAAERVDPEAKKLLDKSREAIKKLKDISYSSKQEMTRGGMETEKSEGDVSFTIDTGGMGMNAFPFRQFKVMSKDPAGKPALQWASNGKQLQKLDFGAKKLFTLETKEALEMPPMEVWEMMPKWMMQELFDRPMTTIVSARKLPDVEIGGVKCYVVELIEEMALPDMDEADEDEEPKKDEKKEPKKEQKLVITSVNSMSVEDSLPRRYVLTTKVEGAGNEQAMFSVSVKDELTKVKANAGLKSEDFAIALPEGFTAEKGTFESMGLQDPSQGAPELKAKAGDVALAFKLNDADGKEVTLESLKGRVVLLDFWATWCGPCKAAMPSIQKIHEKYADKPVTVLGINTWEKSATAGAKYMKDKKFTYGCLLGGDELAMQYGVPGIPTLILIGKDGKILKAGVGFEESEVAEITKLIDEELAKK